MKTFKALFKVFVYFLNRINMVRNYIVDKIFLFLNCYYSPTLSICSDLLLDYCFLFIYICGPIQGITSDLFDSYFIVYLPLIITYCVNSLIWLEMNQFFIGANFFSIKLFIKLMIFAEANKIMIIVFEKYLSAIVNILEGYMSCQVLLFLS